MGFEEVAVVRDDSIACQFVSSFVPYNTRVPRAVDPGDFLYLAVSDMWGPVGEKIAASDFFNG